MLSNVARCPTKAETSRAARMTHMGRTRAGFVATSIVVAIPVALLGYSMLRVHLIGRRARARIDVCGETAVVFGAQVIGDDPGGVLRSRLEHAVGLYRTGRVDRLAMAGGVPVTEDGPSGGHDEVPAMVNYALRSGVPRESILEIRPGQNTREQISSTRRMVIDEGQGPVIAVSSSYHLARIRDEARRQGFDVIVTSPPASPDTATTRLYLSHVLTDAIAGMWYELPQRIAARVNTSAGSFRHLGLLALTGEVPWREALRALRSHDGE